MKKKKTWKWMFGKRRFKFYYQWGYNTRVSGSGTINLIRDFIGTIIYLCIMFNIMSLLWQFCNP